MSNRKEDAKERATTALYMFFFTILGVLLLSILAAPYYSYLRATYMSPPPARRINDFARFVRVAPLAVCGLVIPAAFAVYVAGGIAISQWGQSMTALGIIALAVIALVGLWLIVTAAFWMAAVYFGTVVDPIKDRVVFQVDQESYDMMDYLTLMFIRDLPEFDTVPISAIQRITRLHGTDLYLMGDFGSRRISFVHKQKRDECIYALTSCGLMPGKVFNEFEIT
jgi:hypothetical protein